MTHRLRPTTAMLNHRSSRRQMLATTTGLVAGVAIFSRTGAQGSTPVTEGEWTFTDDRGATVTLPSQPLKIAADLSIATALWDFGIRPVAVSG